jgi:hypothetical protein
LPGKIGASARLTQRSEGGTVVVTSAAVLDPRYFRYAWKRHCASASSQLDWPSRRDIASEEYLPR